MNFQLFLRCGGSRILRRSFSIRLNGEVCTVDASGCSLFSAACTSKSGHYFYKYFIFDSLQRFRRLVRPFFRPLLRS